MKAIIEQYYLVCGHWRQSQTNFQTYHLIISLFILIDTYLPISSGLSVAQPKMF